MTATTERAVRPPARAPLVNALVSVVPIATSLAVTPLLTRGLGPDGYGAWGALVTTIALLQLLDLGVAGSLMPLMVRGRTTADALAVLRAAARVYAGFLAVVATAWLACWPLVAGVARGRVPEVGPSLLLAGLASVIAVMTANLLTIAVRALGRYHRCLVAITLGQLTYLGLVVAQHLTGGLSLAGAAAAQASGALVVAGVCAAALVRELRSTVSARAAAGGLLGFSTSVLGVNLTAAATQYLPPLLATLHLAPRAAGAFALAFYLAVSWRALPLFFLFPLHHRLAGPDAAATARAADRRWLLALAPLTVGGALVVALGVPVLGGREFAGGVGPGLVLVLGFALSLTTAVHTMALRVLGRPRAELRWSAAGAVVQLGLTVALLGPFGAWAPGTALLVGQAVVAVGVRRSFHRLLPAGEQP